MGKQNQRRLEKRKIALMWLDIAAKLSPKDTLFIPMRYSAERNNYRIICKDIIASMEACFEKSIYHGITVFSIHKNGVLYLAFEKSGSNNAVAYIQRNYLKTKQFQVLKQSKYTRKVQIITMLEEGYSKDEIKTALGKTITPKEKLLLE